MNRNLHSPTSLTEFARVFDEEPETIFSKFVTKITNAYNNNYNSINTNTPSTSTSTSQLVTCESSDNPVNFNFINNATPVISSSGSSSSSIKTTEVDEKTDSTSQALDRPRDLPIALSQGRTPVNVVRRISNLVAQKNDVHNYRNSELKKFWMPDSISKECYDCAQKFSTFRRKHHCRLCGQIFCSKCCNQVVPGKIINCSGDLKVCTYCSKVVLSYLKSSDITADLKSDLQALQDDLSSKFSSTSDQKNQNQFEPHLASAYRRKASVGYQEERFVSNPNSGLSNADRKNILQQSHSLKQLYEEMINILSIQNRGADLIIYLISNQKSSNKIQAIAILNAMIEAGFLTSTTPPESSNTSDSDNTYTEFDENTNYKLLRQDDIMRHSGSFQLDVDFASSSVHLKRPALDDTTSTNEDYIQQTAQDNVNLNKTMKDFEIQNSLLSTYGSRPLLEAFCELEDLLVNQLLRNENLDLSWSKPLMTICARVAHTIRPVLCGTDSMDIRNFVTFKKVPQGLRKESTIIGGVVFTKNVAHKNMATRIEKPKILLLQCAIVYQRIEGKFVSIESLLLQEKEYLRNVTSRILNLGPDVLVVSRNVAGIAQDMLRNSGITLVLDVKSSALDRLARCLQCDIVTSIDSNVGRPKLGTCDVFYTKNFLEGNRLIKTLMYFDIKSSPRGCCVLLRGASTYELQRVKKVASMLLFARYNWRLELSFLMDEFARPPSPKPNIFDSKEQSPSIESLNELDYTSKCITETKKKSEDTKINRDKTVNIENVQDFSDPLRATDLSPSVFDTGNTVQFAVEMPYDNRFRTALSSTILSISPFVSFPLPFLETEPGRKCFLRTHFPNELFYSKQWSDNVEKPNYQELVATPIDTEIKPPHEFLTHKITASIDNKEMQTLLASFRASGGRYEKTRTMKFLTKKAEVPKVQQRPIEDYVYKDALDIENHQRLPVLFCSYYYNPSNVKQLSSFCAHPSLLHMHYYGQNDIMLGSFLERYCFRSSYICPSCNLPMRDHIRRYVHSLGCVQVKLTEDTEKLDTGTILMTSRCPICDELTPNIPISDDTWCLSFAKYLELRFHGHAYKRRQISDDTNSNCQHSLHKDHIQYFSYKGIVASFMYTPIEVWETDLPSLTIHFKANRTLLEPLLILEECKKFAMKGYEIYAQIYERIAHLSSDAEFAQLPNLKIMVNRDQLTFKQRVEIVQTLLTEKVPKYYEICDAMLMVKRSLAESIELWGTRLQEASVQSRNVALSKSEIISHTQPVDSGTICTEDLKVEDIDIIEEKSDNIKTVELVAPLNEESVKVDSVDKLTTVDGGNNLKFKFDTKELLDKKSVRNILSQFLPSNVNIITIPSPLPPNEHHTLPLGLFPILVRENDLGSIIAYSLMSADYKKAMETLSVTSSGYISDANNSPILKRKSMHENFMDSESEKEATKNESNDKNQRNNKSNHIELVFHDLTTQFFCKVYFAREFDHMRTNFIEASGKINVNLNDNAESKAARVQRNSFPSEVDVNTDKVFDRKSSNLSLHNANNNSSSSSASTPNKNSQNLSGKTAELLTMEIEEIRRTFCRSVCRTVKWDARGGKSGSQFCKTTDDKLILKQMSKQDVAIFENFAPNYFEYVNQSLVQNQPTLLAKILGVFRVTIKKKDSHSTHTTEDTSVLIMENLFCDREISKKFDLKGSERNRLVDPTNQTDESVFLDENLIQMSWSKPLYILTHSRTILREAINRDSSFLERNGVMDYSLLVGLDSNEKLLVLGIIDYIRTYTFDKRLEFLVKSSLSSQGKLPTVVSPKMYKSRFSEAMDRYFLAVPDRWEGLSKK